jgi:hypothetical protein
MLTAGFRVPAPGTVATVEALRERELRCPICGKGVLADIAYDEHHPPVSPPKQAPESGEVVTFTCGHEVEMGRLEEAARDDPNVERRGADDVVDPGETGGMP